MSQYLGAVLRVAPAARQSGSSRKSWSKSSSPSGPKTAACGIPPVQLDAELMDICRAEAQTRAALAVHPLRRMPLAVITHGGEHFPPRVLPQGHRTSCALLARCSSENEGLIVDLLDWKKF